MAAKVADAPEVEACSRKRLHVQPSMPSKTIKVALAVVRSRNGLMGGRAALSSRSPRPAKAAEVAVAVEVTRRPPSRPPRWNIARSKG